MLFSTDTALQKAHIRRRLCRGDVEKVKFTRDRNVHILTYEARGDGGKLPWWKYIGTMKEVLDMLSPAGDYYREDDWKLNLKPDDMFGWNDYENDPKGDKWVESWVLAIKYFPDDTMELTCPDGYIIKSPIRYLC